MHVKANDVQRGEYNFSPDEYAVLTKLKFVKNKLLNNTNKLGIIRFILNSFCLYMHDVILFIKCF